jgi:methylated-DNA-protein-cysteine methyltransferase-like protein
VKPLNKSSKSEFRAEQFESIPQTWKAIFETVSLIPQGRVTTYGLIARYLKLSGGARTVGWALNHLNKNRHALPAHRVVNRLGCLTGYLHFESPSRMQELLESEGVVVQNMKVVRFSDLVWDPDTELRSRL